mgnify:FL=1
MNIYLLDDIKKLQLHLTYQYQLHQIVKNNQGQSHWQQISTDQFPTLLHEKAQTSIKDFFFAQQENILVFNGEYFQETLPSPNPFVLFGVQSCDLVAVNYQDQFFKNDPYYQARRKHCLLVGLDCISPCEHGFCPTVNAGPGVRSHTADLILHPLVNQPLEKPQWLLIEGSEKGAMAIKHMTIKGQPLETAHWHYLTQRDLTLKACKQKFSDDSHINIAIEKINNNNVSAVFWQKVAIQCIGCSGCTSLCPTCSCYGTRSIKLPNDNISQERFWDSCLYEGFQKEASFHNPTAEAGKRVERFWRHKFSDGIATEFDRYGCVGCGRCEQTCPGVIGVHSIMKRIANDA